jgi:hypothetical protein
VKETKKETEIEKETKKETEIGKETKRDTPLVPKVSLKITRCFEIVLSTYTVFRKDTTKTLARGESRRK